MGGGGESEAIGSERGGVGVLPCALRSFCGALLVPINIPEARFLARLPLYSSSGDNDRHAVRLWGRGCGWTRFRRYQAAFFLEIGYFYIYCEQPRTLSNPTAERFPKYGVCGSKSSDGSSCTNIVNASPRYPF